MLDVHDWDRASRDYRSSMEHDCRGGGFAPLRYRAVFVHRAYNFTRFHTMHRHTKTSTANYFVWVRITFSAAFENIGASFTTTTVSILSLTASGLFPICVVAISGGPAGNQVFGTAIMLFIFCFMGLGMTHTNTRTHTRASTHSHVLCAARAAQTP